MNYSYYDIYILPETDRGVFSRKPSQASIERKAKRAKSSELFDFFLL